MRRAFSKRGRNLSCAPVRVWDSQITEARRTKYHNKIKVK